MPPRSAPGAALNARSTNYGSRRRGAASKSPQMEHLRLLVDELPPPAVLAVVRVASNLLDHPNEDKYRSLRLENVLVKRNFSSAAFLPRGTQTSRRLRFARVDAAAARVGGLWRRRAAPKRRQRQRQTKARS